ncbi:DUF1488 domain-containing protein [Pseudoalteromonas tunicata]|jgi:hypothetical protein|uniref:Uncharacterized protein n=1 Tax=Pseudoalteromonas tunicata D2 TaxID=87626 RepID=A4CDF8_9GAMM|nr:DUF1488 domain-containing protein [Pseudoalteromonas tunicata]ATC92884.1 hypothetical protein PTUN_a0035 [Pseudoalteromonas tunicata]AXT31987.1 DUF1488 domain-containing protein [Pseudoalteromonas tunicata]EAR27000.1 putative unknown membrane associated protein YrdB [Pseudoalteromonas tunicata D2]
MNQAVLFNDDVSFDAQLQQLTFSAMANGQLIQCVIELTNFKLANKNEALVYFQLYKFDYEELAEQLIEDEEYDDNGLIVITQEF